MFLSALFILWNLAIEIPLHSKVRIRTPRGWKSRFKMSSFKEIFIFMLKSLRKVLTNPELRPNGARECHGWFQINWSFFKKNQLILVNFGISCRSEALFAFERHFFVIEKKGKFPAVISQNFFFFTKIHALKLQDMYVSK